MLDCLPRGDNSDFKSKLTDYAQTILDKNKQVELDGALD